MRGVWSWDSEGSQQDQFDTAERGRWDNVKNDKKKFLKNKRKLCPWEAQARKVFRFWQRTHGTRDAEIKHIDWTTTRHTEREEKMMTEKGGKKSIKTTLKVSREPFFHFFRREISRFIFKENKVLSDTRRRKILHKNEIPRRRLSLDKSEAKPDNWCDWKSDTGKWFSIARLPQPFFTLHADREGCEWKSEQSSPLCTFIVSEWWSTKFSMALHRFVHYQIYHSISRAPLSS